MNDIENKILSFLEFGYRVDMVLKELNIEEENLADIIIGLEDKGLVSLQDKNWILTQKGKDILKDIKEELLRKLKIEYLYGNINKDEFQKKKKELESIAVIEKYNVDKRTDEKEDKEKKIICPKCKQENKIMSRYCYKCGETLKG